MAIPNWIFDALSKLIMSGYEWRVLMVILSKTYGKGKTNCSISFDDFVRLTNIKKPHISSTISRLEERNVINRSVFKHTSVFSIQKDPKLWRSMIQIQLSTEAKAKYEKDFDKWIERYPNPMHEQDAKILYLNAISNGISPKFLDECLTGLIRYEKTRAKRFRREVDPWYVMYPTTFLINKKYEEYHKWKDFKEKPPL